MKIYAKIKSLYSIEIAPRNLKTDTSTIFNFNQDIELMELHGYKSIISKIEKSTKKTCYFYESDVIESPELYTDIPCPQPIQYHEWDEDSQSWIEKYDLEVLKQEKKAIIRAAADEEANKYREGYSKSEQDTWVRQEKGAKDLTDDMNSTSDEANWVRNLATARGLELDDMVLKIMNAVNKANTAAYMILGKQQNLEDQITAATSKEEIDSINW